MRFDRLSLAAITALVLLLPGSAAASGSKVSSALALAKQAEKLKPGDWVWAPRVAPKGPVLVYVDLTRQLATVYRNGVRIGVSTISSGKEGHSTPNGVFTILQKNRTHFSSTYDNAPMPNMQRLTWKGVALHAGNLPGFPASHGCVRLPLEFSKLLFGTTSMGGTVVIAGQHGAPVKVEAAGVLAPARPGGTPLPRLALQPDQPFTWTPDASPAGPVSIIVSTGDQMVVVLRNGTEIGRARVMVEQQTDESQVMTMTRAASGKSEWIQVGVSSLTGKASEIISTQGVRDMRLPAEFLAAVRTVMVPGTTVLVTQASVDADSTGGQTTVLASDEPELAK